MDELSGIMKEVRAATKAMNDTVNRVLGNREARTTGFRGFPNVYEGDSCAVLSRKERIALAQVSADAMTEEEQGGISLELLRLFENDTYNQYRLGRHLMGEEKADEIREAIIPYMDSKPGKAYSLPGYLRG